MPARMKDPYGEPNRPRTAAQIHRMRIRGALADALRLLDEGAFPKRVVKEIRFAEKLLTEGHQQWRSWQAATLPPPIRKPRARTARRRTG